MKTMLVHTTSEKLPVRIQRQIKFGANIKGYCIFDSYRLLLIKERDISNEGHNSHIKFKII
jgi:hypothetical protein